jgi:hypothetical protein
MVQTEVLAEAVQMAMVLLMEEQVQELLIKDMTVDSEAYPMKVLEAVVLEQLVRVLLRVMSQDLEAQAYLLQ